MTDTLIRNAAPGDLGAITSIYADAVLNGTASYELEPPDIEEMTRRYHVLTDAGYPYLVAERAGAVAAYAYAGAFRPRPAYRFTVEDSVYVARESRGAGVGRVLLQALVARVTELGFRQIVAVIGDGPGNGASVALHGKLGFEHAGVIRGSGHKHGRWLDTIMMQLSVNGGTATQPDPDWRPGGN